MASKTKKSVTILHGDAVDELPKIKKSSVQLIYIDPPFNTGKEMSYSKIKTTRSKNGEGHAGYQGNKYQREAVSKMSYNDKFDDYINYIMQRIKLAYPLLTKNGSFFLHADYREIHYLKIAMDKLFGRENFINEIIWSYDYGGRSKSRWSAKHDTILWYAKDKDNYIFNYEEIDRIPYMAPKLAGPQKTKIGKTPTDVWWNTIVGTSSQERADGMGYPTQKPLNILERIIQVHSNPGDTVLDFFAGSGTTGVAARINKRKAILIDINKKSTEIIKSRMAKGSSNKDHINNYGILEEIAYTNPDWGLGKDEQWERSPFYFLHALPSSTKGRFGKNLLSEFLIRKGCQVEHVRGRKNDIVVNKKHKCALKFSLLWEDGRYAFQQVRAEGWDFLLCFGISPNDTAHLWYATRGTYASIEQQHSQESRWTHIKPDQTKEWLHGGDLDTGIDLFLKEIKVKK